MQLQYNEEQVKYSVLTEFRAYQAYEQSSPCLQLQTLSRCLNDSLQTRKPSKKLKSTCQRLSHYCEMNRGEAINSSRFYYWTAVRTIVTFIKCVLKETTVITADLCTNCIMCSLQSCAQSIRLWSVMGNQPDQS